MAKTKDLPDEVKKFDASSVSYASRLKLIRKVLVNMKAQSGSVSAAGILFAGDPGVGKTSFIRFVCKLFGLNLVILEVPHVTEEHIINIPYIRYNPVTDKVTHDNITGEQKSDFELILAESNLLSVLRNAKPISDKAYIKSIYSPRGDSNVRKLFEELGGSKTEIPAQINFVRETFRTVLFLDEFFRKTSVSIRNMLRGLLNKNLGLSKLPAYVYPVYASNIDDDGVEEIPANNQFNVIELAAPDKDSWFAYVVNRAKDNGYSIKEEVIDKFYNVLEQEHLNFKDLDADVTISPRRWEQLLFYIDASLPLPTKDGNAARYAKALLTNIKVSFTNYKTGKVSKLAAPVLQAVSDLIDDFNNIQVAPTDTFKPYQWRNVLRHQIYRKMQLGDLRKYVPVLSGMPGIGKTSVAAQVSHSLKLGLITIDCSTLSYEDVMGTPLSSKDSEGNTTTVFSDSKLYKLITKLAKENTPEKIGNHGYKYLIFFDELNRTNVKTFNGLRKVILEKEFDNGKKLPEGSVVIAAINPEDSGGGVTELTKHMVDVLDIIPVAPNWQMAIDWMENKKSELNLAYEDVADGVLDVIKSFADRFKNINAENVEPHFSLLIGDSEGVYISPREYTQVFAEGSINLDMEIEECLAKYKLTFLDPKSPHIQAIDKAAREALFEVFSGVLRGIFIKSNIDSPQFINTLETWFMTDTDASPLRNIISFAGNTSKLSLILEEALKNTNVPLAENIEVINKLKTSLASIDVQVFKEELYEFFDSQLDKMGIDDFVKDLYPLRTYNGSTIKTTKDKVPLFAYFVKELYISIKANNLSNDLQEILSSMSVAYLCTHVVAKHEFDDNITHLVEVCTDKVFAEGK